MNHCTQQASSRRAPRVALAAALFIAISSIGCDPPKARLDVEHIEQLPDGPDGDRRFALDLVLRIESGIETDISIDEIDASGRVESAEKGARFHVGVGPSTHQSRVVESLGPGACSSSAPVTSDGRISFVLSDLRTTEVTSASASFELDPEGTGSRAFAWSAATGVGYSPAVIPSKDGSAWILMGSKLQQFGPGGPMGVLSFDDFRGVAADSDTGTLVTAASSHTTLGLSLEGYAPDGALQWQHDIGLSSDSGRIIASQGRVALVVEATWVKVDGTLLDPQVGDRTLFFDAAHGDLLRALPNAIGGLLPRPRGFASQEGDVLSLLDLDGNVVAERTLAGLVAVAFDADGSIDAIVNDGARYRLVQLDPDGAERWAVPFGDTACTGIPTVVALPGGGAWAAARAYGGGVDVRVARDGSATTMTNRGSLQLFQNGERIIQYDINSGQLSAPVL